MPVKDSRKNKRWRLSLEVLALVTVILSFWIPRRKALGTFVTPDEHSWLTRSANFYFALANGDFASTYQMEHPGVTIMWAGTAGFLERLPEYRESGLGQAYEEEINEYLRKKIRNVTPLDLLHASRRYLVLGNTIVLALAYLYTRRLIGLLPALLGFLLIAFDPFHLALSRILHLDGTLSNLFLLSLLAFMVYLKGRMVYDLIFSGIVGGFCWLTKSPGVFLVPVIVLLVLIQIWRTTSSRKSPKINIFIWKNIWPLITWGVIGMLVFVVFWPAMWIDPVDTLISVFGNAQNYAESGHEPGVFFSGNVAQRVEIAYFYPVTFLWRTTPIVILGLLAGGWGFFTKRKPFDQAGVQMTLLGLIVAVGVFTIGMNLGLKKLDRYLLPVYAPLDIIAGMGWATLVFWMGERNFQIVSKYSTYLVLVLVVGAQLALSLSTYPYYFSYYNPLMGGANKAPQTMQIGWGEGLEQAAFYLNQKPSAKPLRVMSWYPEGSFSYFFKGITRSMVYTSEVTDSKWNNFLSSDYAVVYVNQWQRNRQKQILEYLSALEPEKTIWIDGIEYVRIYKLP